MMAGSVIFVLSFLSLVCADYVNNEIIDKFPSATHPNPSTLDNFNLDYTKLPAGASAKDIRDFIALHLIPSLTNHLSATQAPDGPTARHQSVAQPPNGPMARHQSATQLPNGPTVLHPSAAQLPNGPLAHHLSAAQLPKVVHHLSAAQLPIAPTASHLVNIRPQESSLLSAARLPPVTNAAQLLHLLPQDPSSQAPRLPAHPHQTPALHPAVLIPTSKPQPEPETTTPTSPQNEVPNPEPSKLNPPHKQTDIKHLSGLKDLKSTKQQDVLNSTQVSSLLKLLSGTNFHKMISSLAPVEKKQSYHHKTPQICIQFIELSPEVSKKLLSDVTKMSSEKKTDDDGSTSAQPAKPVEVPAAVTKVS